MGVENMLRSHLPQLPVELDSRLVALSRVEEH